MAGEVLDHRVVAMRKKYLWWAVAAVALVLVGFGLRAILYCQPGTFAYCNYQRVQVGMTQTEVEALLGPGTEIRTARHHPVENVPVVEGERFFEWPPERPPISGDPYIIVTFREGRVCEKHYWEPSF
jgi:hypothetical protein